MRRPLIPGVLAAALGLGLSPRHASAGAFNEPAGRGLVIVQGLYDTGSFSFDPKGRLVRTGRFEKREGAAYLQYGVTDWLMAIVKPDIVSTRVGGPGGGRYTGFGTSVAGAQIQLPNLGPFVTAVQGTFHWPMANHPQNPALTGNTSRDTDGRVLLGAAVPAGPFPAFVDIEAGYRIRGAKSPDEVHLDLTGGVRPRSDVLIMLQSFATLPTQAGTPLYPRSTFVNIEGSVVYDVDAHWSVQLGVFGTVFGRNALRERGLDTAVWYRF